MVSLYPMNIVVQLNIQNMQKIFLPYTTEGTHTSTHVVYYIKGAVKGNENLSLGDIVREKD